MIFFLSKNKNNRLHVRLRNFRLPGECGLSFIWDFNDIDTYMISKTILCFIVANFTDENSELEICLYHCYKENQFIDDYRTKIRGKKNIFDFCNKLTIIEDKNK